MAFSDNQKKNIVSIYKYIPLYKIYLSPTKIYRTNIKVNVYTHLTDLTPYCKRQLNETRIVCFRAKKKKTEETHNSVQYKNTDRKRSLLGVNFVYKSAPILKIGSDRFQTQTRTVSQKHRRIRVVLTWLCLRRSSVFFVYSRCLAVYLCVLKPEAASLADAAASSLNKYEDLWRNTANPIQPHDRESDSSLHKAHHFFSIRLNKAGFETLSLSISKTDDVVNYLNGTQYFLYFYCTITKQIY